MAEIADILLADKPEGSSQVVLFIPSKDREGKQIDQGYWVDEGYESLGKLSAEAPPFRPARESGVMTSVAASCCLKRQ